MRRFRHEFTPELHSEFRDAAVAALREDPREAVQLARLGEFVAREIGDREGRNACLSAWAQAAITQGEFKLALKTLDRAEASAEPGAREAQLETLRVQALSHLERYDEARAAAARALAAHERLGNTGGMAWVEMNLAELAFREDRFRDQLAHLARTERLVPLAERPRLRAAIASNRANALEGRNRFHAARRQFEIARALFVSEGCDHTVAQVDYNAAYAEALRGRYEDALRSYARTAEEFEALGDVRHLAHIDLDRAEIHLLLNVPDTARKLAERAETRFKKLRMPKERAQAWHLLGRAAHLEGDLEAADTSYERAARQFGRLKLPGRQFACTVQRGQVARERALPERARALAKRAVRLAGTADVNPVSAASAELLLAWLDLGKRDVARALRRANDALASCRRVHAPCLRIEAHRIRGAAHRMDGALAEAIDAYTQAIDCLEEYRGGVPPDEYMAAFLSGRTELYAEIVDLLVETGQDAAAFAFAERAKSRALVDLLAGRHGRPAGPAAGGPMPGAQHLRERLAAVYARLFRNGAEPGARSARAVRMAREQARAIEGEMIDLIREQRLGNPAAASLDAVAVPDLAAIRKSLQPGTTLVEYYVAGTTLFTFVLTREELHVVRRPIDAQEVRFLLEQFHFHLAKHERPFVAAQELVLRSTRATLGKLAALVLDPVRESLAGKRLVIVPHGLLHHLPFHALPWDDGWLADRFEVTYAPSAAVYELCAKERAPARGPAAVFALPDEVAPQIEEEARRVAERLGTDRLFLRGDATFERLSEAARDARVVHIATHGMFRHAQPMLSAIRLADRWANLYDLYEMEVRSDLVVLSTCESGIADVTGGDEILGLTRGFLYAGAPALLTTQWRVDDAVTTAFMDRFYDALETLGDPAAAHKRAMAEIRADHPHPYYWAPFFLTGRPLPRHTHEPPGPAASQATRPAGAQSRPLAALGRS